MVEKVRPSQVRTEIKDQQADLARLEMENALRLGNIYEIKAKLPVIGLTPRDFEDFMSNQWRAWKSQIVQDYQVYENEAAAPEPRLQDFPVHDNSAAMDSSTGKEFMDGMTKSLFKASKVGKADAATEETKPTSREDLAGMADGTLGEWENFTNEMWGQIFDAQMMQDYQKKMGEVQREAQRIIALAKQGAIDPEYVLIALAKVNVTKNGVLMTWIGKKAFMTNETMNQVANDLRGTSASDPGYFGQMQDAQSKTRDGSFQLQMLMSDMQKVMNDVAGVLEQVHGYIGEINRTRREIITKVAAQ